MITDLPGSLAQDVRLAFRIAYIIMFVYLGLVGTQCKRLATKLALLQDGKINVSHAAGWLQGVQLWAPLYRMRKIPDWKWWMLMAFVALLGKATDLTTPFIDEWSDYATCPIMRHVRLCDMSDYATCVFGTDNQAGQSGVGMVIYPPEDLEPDENPKWNSQTFILVGNAQIYSNSSGCSSGIYWKADYDPSYCASQLDYMGTWNCSPIVDLGYSSSWEDQDIVGDLQNKSYLYPDADFNEDSGYTIPTNKFDELVAWSWQRTPGSFLSVKAAIENTPDPTETGNSSKLMHVVKCLLYPSPYQHYALLGYPNATAALLKISDTINAEHVFLDWAAMLQGYMYNGKGAGMIPNAEFWMAWMLNNMFMVSGSNDLPTRQAPEWNPTQGCQILLVRIPNGIIFLVGLTFALCLTMTALLIWLWVHVRRFGPRRKCAERAPVDLWSWMSQAVAESHIEPDGTFRVVQEKELNQWRIELTDGEMVRIEKRAATFGVVDEEPKAA